MSARFPAAFYLLMGSGFFATAASSRTPYATVSLHLRTGLLSARIFSAMKTELAELMSAAQVATRWQEAASSLAVDGAMVVVDLEGHCAAPLHGSGGASVEGVRNGETALGSAAAADGEILPFVHVNCEALARFLDPLLADRPQALREFAFGRALGRILAHEMYHILTQSKAHASSGVAKANFSAADLIATRFEFDAAALARIRASQVAPVVEDASTLAEDRDATVQTIDLEPTPAR
jgi:hypothetical protein